MQSSTSRVEGVDIEEREHNKREKNKGAEEEVELKTNRRGKRR
jgi:hypothetical protein